jgi:hypothetical protein
VSGLALGFSFIQADQIEYKMIRAVVKRETRRLNRNSWDTHISNIEHDLHGRQETAYKIVRELNKTERDRIQLNPISKDEWI